MKKGPNTSLKNDIYRSARGGYSRLLNIFCRKCNNLILTYQKDGPGNLRRLYIDRILYPKNFSYLQNKNISDTPVLKCKKCSEILGTPIIYKKENRKTFRLYQDAVTKKIRRIK